MADEYNEDELVPPGWLNEEFFEQKLKERDNKKRTFKVFDLNIAPASKKGDHYASIMFRASYKYRDVATSDVASDCVIVKTMPDVDSEKSKNLESDGIFTMEVRMYNEVIPQLEAMWERCGEPTQFAGRLLHAAMEPRPIIVMEDLCLSGYDVLRERMFNRSEARACFAKLAKWHAVSHKLVVEPEWQQQAALLRQFKYGLFQGAQKMLNSDFISGGMYSMISVLEEAGGFEEYLPKLRALAPQLLTRCHAMNEAYQDGLVGPIYVLNHGDFHGKNLMIQRNDKDSETLDDLLFIDFQIPYMGPWTHDLQYASYTLLSQKFRDQELEDFYRDYFEEFIKSLKKLQFKGKMPAYEDFEEDLKRWSCFNIYLMATFLPLTPLSESEEKPDIDIGLMFSSAAYRKKIYSNPDYVNYLRILLPKYAKMGYLD